VDQPFGPCTPRVSPSRDSCSGSYGRPLGGRPELDPIGVALEPGTAIGDAIGGYCGRLAEALVVSDAVDARTLAPLTKPWLDVIGPFGEDGT
jgi:hypothetical protein